MPRHRPSTGLDPLALRKPEGARRLRLPAGGSRGEPPCPRKYIEGRRSACGGLAATPPKVEDPPVAGWLQLRRRSKIRLRREAGWEDAFRVARNTPAAAPHLRSIQRHKFITFARNTFISDHSPPTCNDDILAAPDTAPRECLQMSSFSPPRPKRRRIDISPDPERRMTYARHEAR